MLKTTNHQTNNFRFYYIFGPVMNTNRRMVGLKLKKSFAISSNATKLGTVYYI